MYPIRLLWFWYRNQCLYVKWNNILSECINVSNGVRQGGIMSPLLFKIYMDNLSSTLNGLNIGCCVKNIWKGIKAKIQFAIWRFVFNITFSFITFY